MALRKPLVIANGQIQQLQGGDTLDATVVEQEIVQLTNSNGGTIVIGQAVYISGADAVDLADASASGTKQVIGLVYDASIASAAVGAVLVDGVLAATTGEWDVVTGGTGGLTPGSIYYLSASAPGGLTDTAPTAVGEYVVRVGVAISTTELKVSILNDVLL